MLHEQKAQLKGLETNKHKVPAYGGGMSSQKLVLIGDGAVGKTSLLISYTTNSFPEEYVPTVFDEYSANVGIDGSFVSLGLWDTAGQEDYDRLRPLSYPGTDVFLVCYCVERPTSFENVKNKWHPEITKHCPEVPWILCATKTDLRTDPDVLSKMKSKCNRGPISFTEGFQLAKSLGAEVYVECSGKKHENKQEVFNAAMRIGLRKQSGLLGLPNQKKKTKKEKCELQ